MAVSTKVPQWQKEVHGKWMNVPTVTVKMALSFVPQPSVTNQTTVAGSAWKRTSVVQSAKDVWQRMENYTLVAPLGRRTTV